MQDSPIVSEPHQNCNINNSTLILSRSHFDLGFFGSKDSPPDIPYSPGTAATHTPEITLRPYQQAMVAATYGHPDHEALALAMQDAREDFTADSKGVAL